MAKYKIIPSSRTIVQSPISIGHKAEKGVEAIEFDLTAWVETYGSGTLTVIMRRWGDAIPYPIALEIDENNKATWTLSDIDTAKAGMAYAQLNYIVGDEVVKKSDIYTFRVMDSLTGEGEPPEAYESWLEHLTHLAAEAMAEVLDIEGIVTDKTLTVDGGIADSKATGDALSALEDAVTEDIDGLKADLGALEPGLSDTAKAALLACFRHISLWTDGNGEQYINVLESALNNDTYPQIRATLNTGSNVVYTDDTINSLKQYLTVRHYETAQSSGTIVAANNYTLSGELVAGTSLITVSYNNMIAAVSIPNVIDFYNIYDWSISSGLEVLRCTGSRDSNNNIWISPGYNTTSRRVAVVSKGRKKIINQQTQQELNYYPIPIPKNAVKYTISTNSNYWVQANCYQLTSEGYVNDLELYVAYSQNPIEKSFTPRENRFMLLLVKPEGTGNFPSDSEPTEITLTFE